MKQNDNLIERYIDIIKTLSFSPEDTSLPRELLVEECGDLSIYYAPFEFVNQDAQIALCGITPGYQQAVLALQEAKYKLAQGATLDRVMHAAKSTASFAGPMRSNLIRMLDHIGIHRVLGIHSCSDLFGHQAGMVHYTSALRYPVFRSLKNYSGSPSMLSTPLLRRQVEMYLLPELQQLSPRTLVIPLGPKVAETLRFAVRQGVIDSNQLLDGLPHPSGANAERIAYFLGEKPASSLSAKTNPFAIDSAKQMLASKIALIDA